MPETRTGGRTGAMPPEKHLGLGFMLPDPPPPPAPSIGKGSSTGSISGAKRKSSESATASATSKVIGNQLDNSTQGQTQPPPPAGLGTEEIVALDDDEEGELIGTTKRKKRCTSKVWEYFTKHTLVVEDNGKKYEQLWGHCNFPRCKAKYRAESNQGTNAFRNHLKSVHKIVKGQLQLSTDKDGGKDVTNIVPFSDCEGVSLAMGGTHEACQ